MSPWGGGRGGVRTMDAEADAEADADALGAVFATLTGGGGVRLLIAAVAEAGIVVVVFTKSLSISCGLLESPKMAPAMPSTAITGSA